MLNLKTLTIAVLAALTLAVAPARADETAATDLPDNQPGKKTGLEKEIAAAAVKAAAEEAARSVLEDTRLDLDIRLIGPTSPTIASQK